MGSPRRVTFLGACEVAPSFISHASSRRVTVKEADVPKPAWGRESVPKTNLFVSYVNWPSDTKPFVSYSEDILPKVTSIVVTPLEAESEPPLALLSSLPPDANLGAPIDNPDAETRQRVISVPTDSPSVPKLARAFSRGRIGPWGLLSTNSVKLEEPDDTAGV